MCIKIEEELKRILTSHKNELKCMNEKWNCCKGSGANYKIRKNIISGEYKYIEYTEWNKGQKKCVALGFNPATNDVKQFDDTNKKILKALEDKQYGSYILLNLYPQVTKSKKELQEDDEENKKFESVLLQALKKIKEKKVDVLIFWGRTVVISDQLFCELKEIMEQSLLYKTVKKGTNEHYHPARVQIEIKKVERTSFVGTYSLK